MLTMHVSDRMAIGIAGGAPIVVDVDNPEIESRSTTTTAARTGWGRGKIAEAYMTQVRIDGAHVLGSPCLLRLLSGPPDVPKCEMPARGCATPSPGSTRASTSRARTTSSTSFASSIAYTGNALTFGLALMPPGAVDNKALKDGGVDGL